MKSAFMKDLRQREKDKNRLKPKKSVKRAKRNTAMILSRKFMTIVYESLTSLISLEESGINVYLKGPNIMRIGIGYYQNVRLTDNAFYLSLNKTDYTKANIQFNFELSENTVNFIEQQEQTKHKHCIQLKKETYVYNCRDYTKTSIELQDIGVVIENGTLMSLIVYLFEDVNNIYTKLEAELDKQTQFIYATMGRPFNVHMGGGMGKSSYALTQMAKMQTRKLILFEDESLQFLNPPALNFR